MPTIVEQLQLDALNPLVAVGDLLRRAKLTASKLGLTDVEGWIESELNGYKGDPPAYREYKGTLWGLNPVRGWVPIGGDPELLDAITRGKTVQPLPVLEQFLVEEDHISVEVHFRNVVILNKMVGFELPRYRVNVSTAFVIELASNVRNQILEWSLSLERKGILGQEFSFTQAEKERARNSDMSISIGSVGTFTGNLGSGNTSGNITSSQWDISRVAEWVGKTKPHVEAVSNDTNDPERTRALFAELEREVTASRPHAQKVNGLVVDLRAILTNAAGSLLASGALAQLNLLIGGSGVAFRQRLRSFSGAETRAPAKT